MLALGSVLELALVAAPPPPADVDLTDMMSRPPPPSSNDDLPVPPRMPSRMRRDAAVMLALLPSSFIIHGPLYIYIYPL